MRATRILTAAVAGLCLSGAAHAAVIDQNFDNTALFTPVGGSVNTKGAKANEGAQWVSLNTNVGVVQPTIENSTAHSPGQSIHMVRGSAGNTTASMTGTRDPAAAISTGLVNEIIWFRRETNGAFIFSGASQPEINNSGVPKVSIADNRLDNPNGVDTATLQVWDRNKAGGAGYVATTVTTLQPNVWYGVKMVVDLDGDTYDTYIDAGSGWQLAKTAGYIASGTGSLTNIHMVQVNPQGGSYFVDDIYVAAVPEPAGLALMGLTGLGLLRRRR